MKRKHKSVRLHKKGYNCAQCVLLCNTKGRRKLYAKLASGFGGGARCGEICGAASGAVMVLGLNGKEAADIKAFNKEFKEHFGAIRCLDLKQKKIPCDELIEYSAKKVKEYI